MPDGGHKHRSNSHNHSPVRSTHKLRTSSKSSKERRHKKRKHKHKKSHRSRSPSTSSSISRSRSRSREYPKHKKRKKSKHHKSKKYTDDSDSSITSYSSDSSSNSYKKRKKKKKHKKRHKKKSSKKRKHKKKKKKKKKRDIGLLEGNMTIRKPSEYKEGEHGFISTNDLIHKMPEFTSWLIDVHGVCVDNLVKRDERKWFAKFCDDWNTSTMPDDKYYDLDKWDKENGGDRRDINTSFGMSDEQKLNMIKREQRQKEQDRRYTARVQEMKRQLIQLKSNNKRGFESLNDQYIPKKETFESLAAKRQAKKVEDRVKRFGKYDTNYTLD